MSLDVYLKYPGKSFVNTGSGIFIRRDGQTIQISREEWDTMHPDREPIIYKPPTIDYVFHYNITGNLAPMAAAAKLYEPLWKPDELNLLHAEKLIPFLENGVYKLSNDVWYWKQYNPANGWGNYERLLDFVKCYLEACKEYWNAKIVTDY